MCGGKEEHFAFGPWKVTGRSSHILQSQCPTPSVCKSAPSDRTGENRQICLFCRYVDELKLPSHPDMTFANNILRLEHANGFGIEFTCIDALRCLSSDNYIPKVAAAQAWREARPLADYSKDDEEHFDWTFTTDYKGTLFSNDKAIAVKETEERIDLEKLKKREQILFYQDVCLYEDELADHGVAQCSVKLRIMKNCFFLLLRYFLRVDNVLIRMNDTRFYHEAGWNYILREYTSRECEASQLNLPVAVLRDPAALCEHIPVRKTLMERLQLPC